jgi:hypothetical protein
MKRSELRQFIKDGVNAITPVLTFSEGLVTEFNADMNRILPTVHLLFEGNDTNLWESRAGVALAPSDSWSIKLLIANLDKMDSTADIYEDIVDHCDEVAQKLIYKYRNIIEGYKLVTMDGISRKKFVKKYTSCLTGIELTFTIHAPDKTNVC